MVVVPKYILANRRLGVLFETKKPCYLKRIIYPEHYISNFNTYGFQWCTCVYVQRINKSM